MHVFYTRNPSIKTTSVCVCVVFHACMQVIYKECIRYMFKKSFSHNKPHKYMHTPSSASKRQPSLQRRGMSPLIQMPGTQRWAIETCTTPGRPRAELKAISITRRASQACLGCRITLWVRRVAILSLRMPTEMSRAVSQCMWFTCVVNDLQ